MLEKRVCIICNEVFQPKNRKNTVCSMECREEYRRVYNNNHYHYKKRAPEKFISDYQHEVV